MKEVSLFLAVHWEMMLPLIFVLFALNWVVALTLQVSITRRLRARLPKAGFTSNPFKGSADASGKFIKYLLSKEYKKLDDSALNLKCRFFIGSLGLMFLLMVTFVVAIATSSRSSPSSPSMHAFDFIHEARIKASPERVWDALVNPESVAKYHLAPLHHLDLKKDGAIVYGAEGKPMIVGKIVEFQPCRRLIHTFRFDPSNQPEAAGDPETVVNYEIRADGEETVLKLRHSGFTGENQTRANISGGWPFILGRLKACLEEK